MKTTPFILCLLASLLVGCSGEPQQQDTKIYGAKDLAEREETLVELIAELEQFVGPEEAQSLRQQVQDYNRSEAALEEALPEITKDKEYYRLRCEYTDQLIKMLQIALDQYR